MNLNMYAPSLDLIPLVINRRVEIHLTRFGLSFEFMPTEDATTYDFEGRPAALLSDEYINHRWMAAHR